MTVESGLSVQSYMEGLGAQARDASKIMATIAAADKNNALRLAAERVIGNADQILSVNQSEVMDANAAGKDPAFIDRMLLDQNRIEGICRALKDISAQDDPVGEVIKSWERPNGLKIERVRTPIGVIAIIYESRPNVTIDAAAIAVKAGNTVILRGGSECIQTSKALFECFRHGIVEAGLPKGAVQFVETPDREAVGALLSGLNGAIDLVIPRGGKSLVARVQSEARAPVLFHLDGICHVYVDRDANLEKAINVSINSKMRRTGVCGAAETLLIDRARLEDFLPPISLSLRSNGCQLRGAPEVCALDKEIAPASEEDWETEYLAPIISIAAVDGVTGAIAHIERYSSGHTESIVTENQETAETFLNRVDSAIVLHNASTQFADGGEFGLGAEIGIATGRLHARGPVGVQELTTFKNIVRGAGQIRP